MFGTKWKSLICEFGEIFFGLGNPSSLARMDIIEGNKTYCIKLRKTSVFYVGNERLLS